LDQHVISLRKTFPPFKRARQEIVGAGCFASNRRDTQPSTGAMLPRKT
jgi:hypothetical protein